MPYNVHALALNGNIVFAGTPDGVYISSDSGQTWNIDTVGMGQKNVISLLVTGNKVIAGISYDPTSSSEPGGVYFSYDNGNTWQEGIGMMTNVSVNSMISSGSMLFAGTGGPYGSEGVFASSDTGSTWQRINNGLTDFMISALALRGNYIYAATGKGVWKRDLTNIVLTVKEGQNDIESFNVYPNPAHGIITIYSTTEVRNGRLEVYSLHGEYRNSVSKVLSFRIIFLFSR